MTQRHAWHSYSGSFVRTGCGQAKKSEEGLTDRGEAPRRSPGEQGQACHKPASGKPPGTDPPRIPAPQRTRPLCLQKSHSSTLINSSVNACSQEGENSNHQMSSLLPDSRGGVKGKIRVKCGFVHRQIPRLLRSGTPTANAGQECW